MKHNFSRTFIWRNLSVLATWPSSIKVILCVKNKRQFSIVLEKYGANFKNDRTYTLILRLRHNVIKTGIRRISLSYSKISLADVSKQLALDSPEDAEFIVAKAIRDGVIDGEIDHQVYFRQATFSNFAFRLEPLPQTTKKTFIQLVIQR